jgi:tetratricopeptide (TPR) repeat protein
MDDPRLIYAEDAHLAERNDYTRRGVVDAYCQCGLLQESEAQNLKTAIGFFDHDFFEFMGLVYANAGMFKCALRWQGELIAYLESACPDSCSDTAGVYASAGYCLLSLGLFEEAIAWTKSCIGPRPISETICRALISYEAELTGGDIRMVERVGRGTRFTVGSYDLDRLREALPRLKGALKAHAPFYEVGGDMVSAEKPKPEAQAGGYPFRPEFDGGSLIRHKMNFIFAVCGQADALVQRGCLAEARRLLWEAAILEPQADVVMERLKALPSQG